MAELFNNSELVHKLIRSNAEFALDLFKRMCVHHGNVLLCPLNISAVLSMILAGAKDETATQILKVLRLEDLASGEEEGGEDEDGEGNKRDLVHVAHQDLLTSLKSLGDDGGANIRWAHRLYLQEDILPNEDLSAQLESNYGSALVTADFARATDDARSQINSWVNEQVPEESWEGGIVGDGVIDLFAVLVGVGVASFQGSWSVPFDDGATRLRPFHVGGGRKVVVDLMRMCQPQDFRLAVDEELSCRLLELPYTGDRLALLVIVPNEAEGFHDLEEKLDVETLNGLIDKLETASVRVSMPRFHVACTFSISDVIREMGAHLLVDQDNADLTGLLADGGTELDEGGGVSLSAIVHGAALRVGEKGTECADASATPVEVEDEGDESEEVVVDKPFIFLLRDTATGTILLIGCTHEPSTDEFFS